MLTNTSKELADIGKPKSMLLDCLQPVLVDKMTMTDVRYTDFLCRMAALGADISAG